MVALATNIAGYDMYHHITRITWAGSQQYISTFSCFRGKLLSCTYVLLTRPASQRSVSADTPRVGPKHPYVLFTMVTHTCPV